METLPVTQESDDFEELEKLLISAREHAETMRQRGIIRQAHRDAREVSRDYTDRLAEKAIFRRLLSDEALDGVRFRWWFEKHGMPGFSHIDNLRVWIDRQISEEEKKANGPAT